MEKTAWIDAFILAFGKLQPSAGLQRLVDLGEEIWPRFGHLDPEKVAKAADKVWVPSDW